MNSDPKYTLGFIGLAITVILAVLKLTGILQISWIVVFLPIIAALIIVAMLFAFLLAALFYKDDNKDDNDKEAEKLESLKDELAKLLEQARSDALYYEHNLRHKTALGINAGFSHQSVHDAVITPGGKVVTTDPKDYLIATKTPNQLVGGGASVNVTPVINCNVVNNSSAKVSQQQRQNADGSIEILTMIEEAVGEYIASPRSDNAFESREYRLSSKQAVM